MLRSERAMKNLLSYVEAFVHDVLGGLEEGLSFLEVRRQTLFSTQGLLDGCGIPEGVQAKILRPGGEELGEMAPTEIAGERSGSVTGTSRGITIQGDAVERDRIAERLVELGLTPVERTGRLRAPLPHAVILGRGTRTTS